MKRGPVRNMICEACGQKTTTTWPNRDICTPCYQKEPTCVCKRCSKSKHQVSEETGLCPLCTEIEARPVAACSRCSQIGVIHNQEDWLCRKCQNFLRSSARRQTIRGIEIKCSVCGELRTSQLLGQEICRSCYAKLNNGTQICSSCDQLKVIFHKSKKLCKQCNKNRLAASSLQRYLANYRTPYSYNKVLFDLLIRDIDWNSVRQNKDRRFRVFGKFLQTHQLPEPLSWEGIEESLPKLEETNRNDPKSIRACLLELGHMLAAQGQLETRDAYIKRRNASSPIARIPEHIRPLLDRYHAWLWERNTTPSNIRLHLDGSAKFWSWAIQRGVKSPEEVQPSLIEDYLLTLYWQWQCSKCEGVTEFDPRNRKPPKTCIHCDALHSMNQVKRDTQNSVRNWRAKLMVFFDWAKGERKALINPVQRRVVAPSPTIRHYLPEVVKALCEYILEPNSEPLEAIVLYLIIFHALSVQELQQAQVPSVIPLNNTISTPSLAEAYYLILPRPKPTKGRVSPGRLSVRLDFPALASDWLKPLLNRYEDQRQKVVKNPDNNYLIVTPTSAHRNMPAGKVYIWEIVRQASIRVLGAACNPNTLRKTVGVMFADQADGGVLRWMGWQANQAFGYTWMDRIAIQPTPVKNLQNNNSAPPSEPL